MTKDALLQINNLSVDFLGQPGITHATRGVSFTISRGEILAIVGESGSGKSVTALSILQLLPSPPAVYSGEILFSLDGHQTIDLLKQSPEQIQLLRGNRIAMIFQEPMSSLNPVFTCGNQVMEAIRLHKKISYIEAKGEALALFEQMQLPNPSAIFDRYPHQLSGGQKQRVMIAMAMSCNPALLICDEPTTALDVTVQQTILELIKELQKKQEMAVIFITHDLGVVAQIADRAIVMYKGEILEEGKTTDLFLNPSHPYTKGLLQCRPALHGKGERLPQVSDFMGSSASGVFEERAAQNTVISPAAAGLVHKSVAYDQPLVEVRNLSVTYPSANKWIGKQAPHLPAIDHISFDIFKGETLGLVGESGCGKSTLGRVLIGLRKPTAGKIFFEGKDLSDYKPPALKHFREKVQIIFQDPFSSLNPRLTIGEAIEEPLFVHRILTNKKQRLEKVIELLERVNLKAEYINRFPHEFSGGQRQRIVIARALALQPSFIVCDESVSALDVSVQAQVLNLLNDLKQDFGFTAVFISHDLSVVRYMSDRMLVMKNGRIEEIGAAEKIYNHPEKEYTRRLLAAIPTAPIPSKNE